MDKDIKNKDDDTQLIAMLAASAPREPLQWFRPAMPEGPPKPPDEKAIAALPENDYEAAQKLYNDYTDARAKYDNQYAYERIIQWPAFYGIAVLERIRNYAAMQKASEEKSEEGGGEK